MKRSILLVLVVLSACNPSQVKKGDPLYDYVGTWYYLSMPLSGPKFRNTNMFGQKPFLGAGTKVRVTSVERVAKTFHGDWLVSAEEVRTLESLESQRIYRIHFDGPDVCRPRGCEANWRLPDDAAFKKRFAEEFVHDDPLAGIPSVRLGLIKAHRVAAWMSPKDVLLSFGEPNFVIQSFGRDHWIYESRECDSMMRLLAIPKLELVFEGAKLEEHEDLSPLDFYILLEPRGNESVCYDPRLDPGPAVVAVDASGAAVGVYGVDPYEMDKLAKKPLSEQLRVLNKMLYPRPTNSGSR